MRTKAVSLAVGLVLADSSIAVLALPAIHRELDVDLGDLHWVLTSFNLVLALVAVPAGLLARRFDPVRAFAGGMGLFALASVGCAAAPGFGALLAFRGVQAVGGAIALVAAADLLPIRTWVAAGAAGAALGPALGGVLTETISWEAVFAVQVPLALLPLAFARGLVPLPRDGQATRPRLAPNVALALLSAGLVAALFLVVLLLIEGWRLSPIAAAAIVSALPLGAIATVPLGRHVPSAAARAAAGAVLVGGGLAALGLLPRAGWAWTIPPQLLVGAGFALAVTAITESAVGGREPRAVHGGLTLAARHAGIVLGLVLLSPLLVGDLDGERHAAEQAGTASLLDSELSPRTKLELAGALADRLSASPGRLPDLAPAFDAIDAKPEEQPVLARLERGFEDVLDRAVTSSFTRSFLLAAGLALAALLPVATLRRAG